MNIINVFSSGGVGDVLILLLKIEKLKQKHPDARIDWYHYEKHFEHYRPIQDIMSKMKCADNKIHITICDKPEKEAKDCCFIFSGTYIDTVVKNEENPYLSSFIGNPNTIITSYNNTLPHIVICQTAGRMKDDTKRTIGPKIIQKVADFFDDRYIVVLGPEKEHGLDFICEYYRNRIINKTGETASVVDALSYINDCCLCIAPDGVIAYYAAMLKKPGIINFHIRELINHYFNRQWAFHTIAMIDGGYHLEDININNPEIRTLFDMAKGIK